MKTEDIQKAIQTIRKDSKKRNFPQTVELILGLQNLDLKKPDHQVEFFTTLSKSPKKRRICAFVGPELKDEAEKVCDLIITADDFPKYSDKKKAKALAVGYDFFIAQANIMAKVATAFGRTLGPRGKMPNPKAGCVVPPKANLQPLYDKLQRTIKVSAKTQLQLQLSVANEDMEDKDIVENIAHVYKQLTHHLPTHENNIKTAYIKFTMSKPVRVL